jgi:hypothetical protein
MEWCEWQAQRLAETADGTALEWELEQAPENAAFPSDSAGARARLRRAAGCRSRLPGVPPKLE